MKKDELYLYSARDTETGKLVSDITNPGKKFWQREAACVEAINNYNFKQNYYGRRANHGQLELVIWRLEEVVKNKEEQDSLQ